MSLLIGYEFIASQVFVIISVLIGVPIATISNGKLKLKTEPNFEKKSDESQSTKHNQSKTLINQDNKNNSLIFSEFGCNCDLIFC